MKPTSTDLAVMRGTQSVFLNQLAKIETAAGHTCGRSRRTALSYPIWGMRILKTCSILGPCFSPEGDVFHDPNTKNFALLTTVTVLTAAPISAQTVLSGDHSIGGLGCIGLVCGNSETFDGSDQLKSKANGGDVVSGTPTTGGTTCGGGCDRVFTEDYDLVDQSAYADTMWKQGYLPNVGPTPENQPLNVSEKLGGMLNALEHAHVFIDRQRLQIERQTAEVASLKTAHSEEIAAVRAELAHLAARIDSLQ